jgi:hypothetical protein
MKIVGVRNSLIGCTGMSEIAIEEKMNGTRNGINRMGLIQLIAAHELQTRIEKVVFKNTLFV